MEANNRLNSIRNFFCSAANLACSRSMRAIRSLLRRVTNGMDTGGATGDGAKTSRRRVGWRRVTLGMSISLSS